MNFYKKIIPSKNLRFKILNMLSFIPDKAMLRIQYFIKLKRWLNLKNPKRYTEKIQWYKLYYRNPLMVKCVDKYEVREYVKEKGLEHILNTLYGVYDSFDEIDFDALPNKFIIKANNGSGTNFICKDKSKLDIAELRKEFKNFFMQAGTSAGREWAYDDVKPKIIIEALLEDNEHPNEGIRDYKIFCFGGKAEYIDYHVDRFGDHRRNFYNTDWKNMCIGTHYKTSDEEYPRPEKLREMLDIAEILSRDFPAVRVDLYCVDGKIYFGELTFYPASGYFLFEPCGFDFEIGEKFILPPNNTF